MGKFWLIVLVLALAVLGFIVVSGKFSSPPDKAVIEQPLEVAETEPRQTEPVQPIEPPVQQQAETPKPAAPPSAADEAFAFEDVRAQQIYQMAETESKIARKIMSYKRMVDYCREILRDYPTSPYAEKARELLRQMPERHREMHNVTNEEMGL